ncbi:hypothetical protein VNO77_03175 [Canavalia gladiata]|uniref:Uncharacterized protein n=1 Tax=Canavalia gladiata TaxID=3824 RepID=A0AAN9MZE6_CANGL
MRGSFAGVAPTFLESFGETLFLAVCRVWELSRKGDLLVCAARGLVTIVGPGPRYRPRVTPAPRLLIRAQSLQWVVKLAYGRWRAQDTKISLCLAPLFTSGKIEYVDGEPKEGIDSLGVSFRLHTRSVQVSGFSFTTFESRNSKVCSDCIRFS